MIAYCGLECSECDAYLATVDDSDTLRIETAQKWSKMYQHEIKPEQINCDGCNSDGIKFSHCNNCEIRQCCTSKKLAHCAECSEYICDALAAFCILAPEAGVALEKLRE